MGGLQETQKTLLDKEGGFSGKFCPLCKCVREWKGSPINFSYRVSERSIIETVNLERFIRESRFKIRNFRPRTFPAICNKIYSNIKLIKIKIDKNSDQTFYINFSCLYSNIAPFLLITFIYINVDLVLYICQNEGCCSVSCPGIKIRSVFVIYNKSVLRVEVGKTVRMR